MNVSGTLNECVGKRKSKVDDGLVQGWHPLSKRRHYIEVEFVDPGENCYIVLGFARRTTQRTGIWDEVGVQWRTMQMIERSFMAVEWKITLGLDDTREQEEEEEEEDGEELDQEHDGKNVVIFFTQNGKFIVKKDIIGMTSSEEKLKVDLHPLSG
ncbi:hypothetical protein NDU88_008248 [Pleurodeles waltl]|uniref:Uncharacterized protein n=1 Tax=Pleurodeles waltl TaxID=8319 RepID=A0AAV7QU40_PLEWA|nr:hypothetical protein NDU88_008248 [Pleurodeles waltl]